MFAGRKEPLRCLVEVFAVGSLWLSCWKSVPCFWDLVGLLEMCVEFILPCKSNCELKGFCLESPSSLVGGEFYDLLSSAHSLQMHLLLLKLESMDLISLPSSASLVE